MNQYWKRLHELADNIGIQETLEILERFNGLSASAGYRPVEYDCGGGIKICLSPEFVSCIGNKPEYWYICKTIANDKRFRSMWGSSLRLLYWHESGDWNHCTPYQFKTAEEAIEFHRHYILDNDSVDVREE